MLRNLVLASVLAVGLASLVPAAWSAGYPPAGGEPLDVIPVYGSGYPPAGGEPLDVIPVYGSGYPPAGGEPLDAPVTQTEVAARSRSLASEVKLFLGQRDGWRVVARLAAQFVR